MCFHNCVINHTYTLSKMEQRKEFVKKMAKEAFKCYKDYALGAWAVQPVEKQPFDYLENKKTGWTLVSAMSTLWVMDLKEEFEFGKEWIEKEMNFAVKDEAIIIFDIVADIIGGLLSCYALTKDYMFLNKAKEIADILKDSYSTPTGLPYLYLNPYDINYKDYNLSELGASKLEYQYLSDLTGDSQYVERVNKTRKLLKQITKPKDGLYMDHLSIETGEWASDDSTLFYNGKQFYIDLCKSFIQSNGRDVESIEMYKEALDAIDRAEMFAVSENGYVYPRDYNRKRLDELDWMEDEGAYMGAMLSLGAEAIKKSLNDESIDEDKRKVELQRIERHWQLARDITETYQKVNKRLKTGLPIAAVDMKQENGEDNKFIQCVGFCLGSELAESFFILWRLTHEEKYREYAWQMVQAIHAHCRVEETGGYTNIAIDVNQVEPVEKLDIQATTFLRATLKYLYLTFCDDDLLPLDHWVFSAAGHPLPILGRNYAYPVI